MTAAGSNHAIVPIPLERARAHGFEREHVRPIVRALATPTAHPSTEAWPAIGRAVGGSLAAADAALRRCA